MTKTETKHASGVIFSKDTPYIALKGELWGVFCEEFGENWPRNNTALYVHISLIWGDMYSSCSLYLQFDGGLYTTAVVIGGAYKLSASAKLKPTLTEVSAAAID